MTDMDALRARLRGARGASETLPGFDPGRAGDAPGPLFADWLWQAFEDAVPEPQVMTLSTAGAGGRPSSRVLILRGLECEGDECAFRFATDARSRKGVDLAARPYAALNWYWPAQGRQIRAAGPVEVLGGQAAREDFLGRGEASRVAGFAGPMSAALPGPEAYESGRARAREIVADDPGAVPGDHTVYLLRAEEVEFFQLAADRFHRRLRFTREGARWAHGQLWP
jgi:pyridoxamine 5'-phosphate oxidase